MWYNGKKKRPGCIRSPGIYLTTFYENGLRLNRVALSKKSDSAEYPSQTAYVLHDIQKWCKIIICRIGTVNSVIYCNKTDIFLREHHFRIETYLQIVSAKSGHIFDDHCSHSAGFNLCQQRIECRSVEVRS